jgi:hypothetical protein
VSESLPADAHPIEAVKRARLIEAESTDRGKTFRAADHPGWQMYLGADGLYHPMPGVVPVPTPLGLSWRAAP